MLLYLYDPKTNLATPTTYDFIEELTGMKRSVLMSYKSIKRIIKNIDCYLVDDNITLQQRRSWYEKVKYQDEYWMTIIGSEDQFKVSNHGRVKRLYKNGKEKFMLPYQRKGTGNLWIKVKLKGKYAEYKVGHLVATHFIRALHPGEIVVRKNGIVTDDFAGNLKICTRKEVGLMTGHKSKSKPVVQLDPLTFEVIDEFRSAREAGRKTNFSYTSVLDRCNKKYQYKNNDFVFMFSEEYESQYCQ